MSRFPSFVDPLFYLSSFQSLVKSPSPSGDGLFHFRPASRRGLCVTECSGQITSFGPLDRSLLPARRMKIRWAAPAGNASLTGRQLTNAFSLSRFDGPGVQIPVYRDTDCHVSLSGLLAMTQKFGRQQHHNWRRLLRKPLSLRTSPQTGVAIRSPRYNPI